MEKEHPLIKGIKNLLFPDDGKALFREVQKLQMKDQLPVLQKAFDAQQQQLVQLEQGILLRTGKNGEEIEQLTKDEILSLLKKHMNKIEARRMVALAKALATLKKNIEEIQKKTQ